MCEAENTVCLGCCADRNEIKLLNNVEKLRSHHQDNYTRPACRMPGPEVRIVDQGDGVCVIHFLLDNCKHAQIEIKTDNQNIKGFMLHFAAKD